MQISVLMELLVSTTRTAIARFHAVRRQRRAYLALKDLPQYLLEDVGQGHYRERQELDQDQLGRPADYFRS